LTVYTKGRQVPEPIRPPKLADIAWAAGFIEGEGTFTRLRGARAKNYSFRVSASQKNLEPLLRLQEVFGGSIKTKKCKKSWWEEQRRFIYSSRTNIWRVYGKEAQKVAHLLFPLLSQQRKNQALELLDLSYRNPNSCPKGPKRRRK
jgi:hypothetical protein